MSAAIASTHEIIKEARAGRMFILVDDEDRENEGDLIIPAADTTPEAINFMCTHGRGLVCLTLPPERVEELNLPMMATRNTSRFETAFTVSIEAREGVSTGISAMDRAHTILTAVDPEKHASDIVTPGHVFPLRARKGGVLVRAGHTEAGCDIARLAGKYPSSVICEILKPNGTMARLPDLVEFAATHGLKIGTIADLIEYRAQFDKAVTLKSRKQVTSEFGGDWTMSIYVDTINQVEHAALVKGDPSGDAPILVRTHALHESNDLLGIGPKRSDDLSASMKRIAEAGRGVVCLFREPHRELMRRQGEQVVLNIGIGARMLQDLGVSKLILLTDSDETVYPSLHHYDLEVVARQRIHDGTAQPPI